MAAPKVDDYRFGRVVIDGKPYHHDVIILLHGVQEGWRRLSGHSLSFEDLSWMPAERPLMLIVGTGAFGRVAIPKPTRQQIETRGIRLVALPTAQACEEYNRLREKQDIVAGLHLAC